MFRVKEICKRDLQTTTDVEEVNGERVLLK
jgi:hypothetical protein